MKARKLFEQKPKTALTPPKISTLQNDKILKNGSNGEAVETKTKRSYNKKSPSEPKDQNNDANSGDQTKSKNKVGRPRKIEEGM
jgi:hypothetical protein